ncbi:MAG TPA: adaptor protein MecA [Epulopiscium sp.]|nr:adaptor protein MecA [Candidatus Epulonipiscium sp.]
MRIEKVNDTQIRVTLSHSDLNPRDIKISELAYGSKKAQKLFRDMMTQAYEEFGFETENIPLMIEAVPLSRESIMIVVTKIEDPTQIDDKLGELGERPTHRTFKSQDDEIDTHTDKPSAPTKNTKQPENLVLIYSFSSLEQLTDAGHRINTIYCGMNSMYKQDEHTYFLVLHPNFMHKTTQIQLESVLDEFGSKHVSSSLGERYLMEHSTLLIKDKAVEVLTTYL